MRHRFADPKNAREARARKPVVAAIDRFWKAFARKTKQLDDLFSGRVSWDLPAWMATHLGAVSQDLMWEYGPALRGDGHRLEVIEYILDLSTEFGTHLIAQQREVHRRGLEVQPPQYVGELLGRDAGPVGHELPEFHHRAAERGHGAQQLDRSLQVRLVQLVLAAVDARPHPADPPEGVRRGDLALKRAERPETAEAAHRWRGAPHSCEHCCQRWVRRRGAHVFGQLFEHVGKGEVCLSGHR